MNSHSLQASHRVTDMGDVGARFDRDGRWTGVRPRTTCNTY